MQVLFTTLREGGTVTPDILLVCLIPSFLIFSVADYVQASADETYLYRAKESKDAIKKTNIYLLQRGPRLPLGLKDHVVLCALSPAGCAILQKRTQQTAIINERTLPLPIVILNKRDRRP